MRNFLTASVLAIAVAAALPAQAQTAKPAPAAPDMCNGSLTKSAQPALAGYNNAVNAGVAANVATAKAAAQAQLKTDMDRCVFGQIAFNEAVKSGDAAQIAQRVADLAAIPATNRAVLEPLMVIAAKAKLASKDYAGASSLLDQALAVNPKDADALILLADTRYRTGRKAEAPALAMKAIAAAEATGGKASEDWYKHAVAMAYEAKVQGSSDIARRWVAAYPNPANWRDAIRIVQLDSGIVDKDLIDVYRLQNATGSLADKADYINYASLAWRSGTPGETDAVLKAGIAAGKLKATDFAVSSLVKLATPKLASDKASLDAGTAKAITSGVSASVMNYGNAYFGYGNYAKAAEAFRKAAAMPGADAASANLRLGIALGMAGDKAGAATALNAVTGNKSALAQMWLTYFNSRA